MRTSLPLALLLFAATTAASASTLRCSVRDSQSSPSCPKDQYCLAAKPHSYCTKKLDGGEQCTKDIACRAGVCFIEKPPRHPKRVCASVPLKDYPLGAQCTQSKQCKSQFCDRGYCTAPVGAGKKCPKEVGCAELSKGAHCLNEPATFLVYDAAGKAQPHRLEAGHCSYVSNLGEGMRCHSDANCYAAAKLVCSKETATCTPKPPTDLPYDAVCSAASQCASGACVAGRCACTAADCDAASFCDADAAAAVCKPKVTYSNPCGNDGMCTTGWCVPQAFCGCRSTADCPDQSYMRCDVARGVCGGQH